MKRRSLKQDKLAQVYDTEILPVWSERFGRMLLSEAQVPDKGLVLNVACGTGYPALEILEKMESGRIIAIDSFSALLDVAREKAGGLSGKRIFFRTEGGRDRLSFDSDVYDLTFSNLGLGELDLPPAEAIRELARVTAPGGQVLVTLPLRGTWAEFLDIYREVLTKHDRHETLERLTEYEATLPDPEEALAWMERAGLENVDLVVDEFSLLFKSSREFFFAPVIEFGPLRDWKAVAGSGQEMQDIFWFIKEAIDAYFGGRAFTATVVAGCLSGIRGEAQPEEEPTGPEEGGTVELEDGAPLEEQPGKEVSGLLSADVPEGLGVVGDDLDRLRFPDEEEEGAERQEPATSPGGPDGSQEPGSPEEASSVPPPVRPEEFLDAPDFPEPPSIPSRSQGASDVIPLMEPGEVSIHELDEDDLEVLEEDEVDEDELDTNVRRVEDLPEHLQKEIKDSDQE